MNIASELRALEEKLLQPDFRRNRSVVAALLADDFREFGSSGRAWTKQQILNHLETEVHFEAAMCDFDAIELAAGAVLVTYRITTLRSGEKAAQSLRSSIWIKRDDHWQMLFSSGNAHHPWLVGLPEILARGLSRIHAGCRRPVAEVKRRLNMTSPVISSEKCGSFWIRRF